MLTLSDQARALHVIDEELQKLLAELHGVQCAKETLLAQEANLKKTIATLRQVGWTLLGET